MKKKLNGLVAISALSLMWARSASPAVIPEMYNNGMNAILNTLVINCGSPENQPCWNNTLFQLRQAYVDIANDQPPGSDWHDTYTAVVTDSAMFASS